MSYFEKQLKPNMSLKSVFFHWKMVTYLNHFVSLVSGHYHIGGRPSENSTRGQAVGIGFCSNSKKGTIWVNK